MMTEKIQTAAETAADDFIPVLRFAAASDVHIQRYNDIRSRRMAKIFKVSYAIAQADEHYKKLDGVIFAGDNADNGAGAQFMTFRAVLNDNIKKGTQPMKLSPTTKMFHFSPAVIRRDNSSARFSSICGFSAKM